MTGSNRSVCAAVGPSCATERHRTPPWTTPNAGALTHTSWALTDALAIFPGVKVEIHLSNPAAREPFRHVSTLAGVVDGSIAGFGELSYDLALVAVVELLGT